MRASADKLCGLRCITLSVPSYVWLISILALGALTGCGSRGGSDGGGASQYSVAVPDTLEVTVRRGERKSFSVDVAFNGDGLLVGYPTGGNQPSWLLISAPEISQSPARVEFEVQAFDLARGTHRTTLRFITGNAETGEHIYKDMQLTVRAEEPLFLYSSTFNGVNFDSYNGASVPPQQIYITGGEVGDDWSIEVDYDIGDDWLEIDKTQGVVKSVDTAITLRPKTVNQGYYKATLYLRDKDNNYSGEVNVYYESTYHITLDGDTDLGTLSQNSTPEDLQFTLTLNPNNWPEGESITWTLGTDQQWLVPAQTEGNFAGQQSLLFAIDPEALALEGDTGYYSVYATIRLNEASGAIGTLEHQVGVRVELDQKLAINGDVYFEIDQDSENTTGELTVLTPYHGVLSHNVPWTATSSEPWLTLENTSGSTLADSVLRFTVDAAAVASFDGALPQVVITIEPDHPQYSAISVYPEIVVKLPKITAVTPNTHSQGQSSTIKIFGKNFIADDTYRFELGGKVIEGVAQSTTMISATIPSSLAEGQYQLTVANNLGLELNAADITIKAPGQHSDNRWVLSSPYKSMVIDTWRDSAYFYSDDVNAIGQLDFLADTGELTTPSDAIESMAFTADGEHIIVARDVGGQLDLRWLEPKTFMSSSQSIFASPLLMLSASVKIMPVFGGEVYVHSQIGFPLFEGIDGNNFFARGSAEFYSAVSHDGTTILVASNNEINIFDYAGNSIQQLSEVTEDLNAAKVAIARNGSALLVGNKFFNQYDNLDYAIFGELESEEVINSVALAPKASAAFVQYYVNNQAVIYRYDLGGSETREIYPADSEPLATTITEGEQVLQMQVSDDGGALLVLCLASDKTHSVFYTIPL